MANKNMKNNLFWKFMAYDTVDENGTFKFGTNVNVYAENEQEALNKVKKLIKKKNYWLNNVTEERVYENTEKIATIQEKALELLKKCCK